MMTPTIYGCAALLAAALLGCQRPAAHERPTGAPLSLRQAEAGPSLFEAADAGDLRKVLDLLSAGVPIDAAHPSGLTPLDIAVFRRNDDVAQALRDHGATLGVHAAAGLDLIPELGAMLDREPGQVGHRLGAYPPLHWAVLRGRTRAAQLLVQRGASPNEGGALNGATSMHLAAESDQPDMLQLLLDAGGAIGVEDAYGRQPLNYAARAGAVSAAGWLISRGARFDAAAPNGETALATASMHGRLGVVELLLAWPTGKTPLDAALYDAAAYGHASTVAALLRAGADANAGNAGGEVPLLAAVNGGHADVVKQLLEAGANANARDATGFPALHRASFTGNVDVVQELIDAGADLNLRDESGLTAQEASPSHRHPAVIERLKAAASQ